MRKGLAGFVERLAALDGLTDLSLTTNGILLPGCAAELRAAGLRRVNVSIDSLDEGRYAQLTRGARLGDALAGLDAALSAGFSPVKVNAVLLAGVEDEVDGFVELTRRPTCTCASSSTCRSTAAWRPTASSCRPDSCSSACTPTIASTAVDGPFGLGPARYYRVPGRAGHDRLHRRRLRPLLRPLQPAAADGRRPAQDLPVLGARARARRAAAASAGRPRLPPPSPTPSTARASTAVSRRPTAAAACRRSGGRIAS